MKYINIVLKGLSQIMLQENAITGLLFLIGIFYGSLFMGFAAIFSVCCGTLTAYMFGYEKTGIEKGLYGFSAALVGVACALFFKPAIIVWIFIIIGSVVATMIQHYFIMKTIPVFTFPFVIATWLILYFVQNFYPQFITLPDSSSISGNFFLFFPFKGFGQVIFQKSIFSGIIFFLAVFINSQVSALYGLAAAVLAAVLSYLFFAPVPDIAMGLFSYNAVLCAIVFAKDKIKDIAWVILAVVVSVIISLIMFRYQLVQLTFPFVAATCIILFFRKLRTISYRGKTNQDAVV